MNKMEFTSFQIPYSTMDDEKSSSPYIKPLEFDMNSVMPAGTYRIIDGEICRILYGPARLYE